jgi:hypothetical protein
VITGQEAFWYLKPEHRKGHGGRLLCALEDLARAKGAKIFSVVAESSERSEGLARLYKTRGYRLSETIYRKVY